MSTALFEAPDVGTELKRFSPADAAIAEMAREYLPLTIGGIDDTAGYKLVHNARMVVKSHRVAVEKTRKELKADALEYGRKVDAEAKRITALLAPIEEHLEAEEKAVDDAKEAIRNAARLKAEAEARAKAEAEEAARKAAQEAEDARLKAEAEKLAAERRAMEEEAARVRAEQKAAQDKIYAERRSVELEKARQEAAEKARVETEQRLAREAEAKRKADEAREATLKAKAQAEEAARLKAEALRPDREKLLAVADAIEAIPVPKVSADAQGAAESLRMFLHDAAETCRLIVGNMLDK